ncbi:MAG TPA: hypothetical protein VIH35_06195 [Kiritimatiellia bacterium]
MTARFNSALCAVVAALFLASPVLSKRLDPNGYSGGRSRNVAARAERNSSALATMLGEFRTAMSDIMYIKTERYLDSGVGYQPHLKKEILTVSGAQKEIDEHQAEVKEAAEGGEEHHGDEDFAGTPTMIPSEATDFRGIIGRLEREVKPWRDPALGHQHTDGTELLPWFRLMTLSDPHYILGYTVGGWWLKSRNLDAAIRFAHEGIEKNPDAFQIYFTLGQLYFEKGRLISGVEKALTPPPEAMPDMIKARDFYLKAGDLAIAQRPATATWDTDIPEWDHYMEQDARFSCRMAVLSEWHFGDRAQAIALAKRYVEAFKGDNLMNRFTTMQEP